MRWVLAALLFPLLGCHGCRRTPDGNVHADGGLDAGAGAIDAAVSRGPFTGRIVARSLGLDLHLVRMKEDGLVVTSGPAIWSVGQDGSLHPIGTAADAIPFLLPGDDEIGGYDARLFDLGDDAVSGSATTPFVRTSDAAAFQWTGKVWTKTASPPAPERRSPYGRARIVPDDTRDLPEGYDWSRRNALPSAIVWLGYKFEPGYGARHIDEAVIAPTPGHPTRKIDFPVEDDKGTTYRACEFIESADDRAYIACVTSHDAETVYFQHTNYVLDGDHWTPLALKIPEHGERAFDAEGALWYVAGGNGPASSWLVRVGRDGKEERFDPPEPPAELAAPSYRSEDIPIGSSDSSADIRHWIATTLVGSAPSKAMGWIYEIIPRRSGEVWVVGRDSSIDEATTSIVRYARDSGGPAPMLIRSSADARRAAQEARGVRTWGGSCISVFIPFPRASRDAAIDPAAFYADHQSDIDRAVALSDSKASKTEAPLEVAIVEGRLDGRRVGGLLFVRSDPDVDEKRLVTAVQKISVIATPDPASPPTITCTPPELDRIVKRLRVARPERY